MSCPRERHRKGADKRVKSAKIKTEILFIERCLSLLKPGGRLGIVLPEGVFNNPSLAYVREFCENRAFIRAVVSLPQETFFSSGASVKASLLFLQKFTEPEQADFDAKQAEAGAEVKARYADAMAAETARIETAIAAAKEARDAERRKALQKELADYRKADGRDHRQGNPRPPQGALPLSDLPLRRAEGGDHRHGRAGPERTRSERQPAAGHRKDLPGTLPGVPARSQAVLPDGGKGMTATTPMTSRAFAVWWKDLERWDVKFFSARVCSSYPVVRLAPLIYEHTERIKLFDYPETTFRILGVTNTGGIFHAYDSLGKKINQPYQRVDAGDFAYNPYRVNVGSIGIVPTELGGNYISPAYVVFATDKAKLLSEYLILILKAGWFNPMVRAATAGSVRQNLTFALLCTLEIPLPPLAEQKAIVARWRKAQDEIVAASVRVEELANGIQRLFLEYLGLKLPQQQEKPKVFALLWKDFERWGIGYNQQALAGLNPGMGKYPIVYLRDAIADLENGWSPQCLNRPAEDAEWGVLKLGAVSFGLFNDRENKALPKHLNPLPMLEVKQGQVLISRANIPRLVGACAIVNEARPRLMLCDKIFRVVFRADSAIEPEYLAEVMKIPQVRRQIEAAATGTSATMQNITKPSLLALSLPLPPLSVQRQILLEIAAGRKEIAHEREAADRLARDIDAEVEALILGAKPLSG